MKLWGGFSPRNAAKQFADTINPFDGTNTDYDVFETRSFGGGARTAGSGQDIWFGEPQAPVNAGWTQGSTGGLNYTGVPQNTPAPTNNGGGGGGGGGVDPAVAAEMARRQRMSDEALGIKNRLLGREGEVDSILNEILSLIDITLGDTKDRRTKRFDADTAALLESLNAATPEVEKAFASLGLSNSTFVGDRLKGVRDEWGKNQENAETQYNDDLAEYSAKAEANRSDARGSAGKAKNAINYVRNVEADADNLGRLAESEKTFSDMITDFGGQKSRFGTQGDFLKELEGIGSDYDFGKTLAAFGDFAGSAASINNPNRAAGVAEGIKGVGDKVKKKLTEVQVNNPAMAAAA